LFFGLKDSAGLAEDEPARAASGTAMNEEAGAPFVFDMMSAADYRAADPDTLKHYESHVLPADLYLGLCPAARPVPCIVHGDSEQGAECLGAGAFDFMRGGWGLPELCARLKRLWNPAVEAGGRILELRGRMISYRTTGTAFAGEEDTLYLSPREAVLLRMFLASPGRILPASVLCPPLGIPRRASRALSMQISRLRKKLGRVSPALGAALVAAGAGSYALMG